MADYSKSTIYVYFKNKDDIYYNIVFEYMIILKEKIKKCIEENDNCEDFYYAICSLLVEFEQKYPMYFDCILGNINVNKEDFLKLPVLKNIYNVGEEINQMIISVLRKAKERGGVIDEIELLPTSFVLWSSISSLISVSSNKEEYFYNRLQMDRTEFLKFGFEKLLNLIKKRS